MLKHMMKFVLIFLFPILLLAENNISAKISLLNSNINKDIKAQYINAVNQCVKEFPNVDVDIVLAVFKVESNFDHKAVNYKSRDFGIGQINAINMIYYKLDLGRQMTDIQYAICNTFMILSELEKKYKEADWFTRYHSFKSIYRRSYAQKLSNYLKILGRDRDANK